MQRRRRLPRLLLNAATAVSLLLSIAAVILWVRSYREFDWLIWDAGRWSAFLETGGGQFRFEHTRVVDGRDEPSRGFSHRVDRVDGPLAERMPGSEVRFEGYGFWIVTGERWGDDHHAAFVPAWFVVLLTLALPVVRFGAAWLVRPPGRAGLCLSCGYDLRATPARCPECGAIPPPPAPPPTYS